MKLCVCIHVPSDGETTGAENTNSRKGRRIFIAPNSIEFLHGSGWYVGNETMGLGRGGKLNWNDGNDGDAAVFFRACPGRLARRVSSRLTVPGGVLEIFLGPPFRAGRPGAGSLGGRDVLEGSPGHPSCPT
jgi:hypothetical protein